jgi:mevalonate kinase
LLDSGIVGETAPMVTIFMENLKDKGFRAKNQFVKYTDESFRWRYESIVYEY